MNAQPLLSVVIPAFKDQAALRAQLPLLVNYLPTLHKTFEIILVDDGGAPEETAAIAKSMNCRFECNPRNLGKGAAVRRGMLAARGSYRVFTDADIPYELDAFAHALWCLEQRGFDMVAGDRTLPGSTYHEEIGLSRKLASKACSFVVGRFLTGGWFDTQCGFKGFRDVVAKDLFGVARVDGFAFDIELIYTALHRNYDIKRIPVKLRCQDGSSVHVLRDGTRMARDVVRIRALRAMGAYGQRPRDADPLDVPWLKHEDPV